MVRFVEAWPDEAQVRALAQQLGWSHFKEILYLQDPLARQFFLCRDVPNGALERSHTARTGSRNALRADSDLPASGSRHSGGVGTASRFRQDDAGIGFRDPYLLDFLGLQDTYSERDLEAAILQELERFLLELGSDFAFVARQKRMTIGDQDFYLAGLEFPTVTQLL
jgi:predicted nuclease of restriction endonuclease-like (RecB) superfamily